MTVEIKSYTVQEFSEWLKNRPIDSVYVEARDIEEVLEDGAIKGYDYIIPYFLSNRDPELFAKKYSVIDKDIQLVISCKSGRRSRFSAEYITKNFGFKNVYNVEGGILKWKELGYPVETVTSV